MKFDEAINGTNFMYLKSHFTIETFFTKDFFIQFMIVASIITAAFLIEYLVVKKVKHIKYSAYFNDVFKIVRPVIMLLFLSVAIFIIRPDEIDQSASYILDGTSSWILLDFASTVVTVLLLLRLVIIFLRYIFKPGPWTRPFENIVAGLIVLTYLMVELGLYDQIQNFLQSINFVVGKQNLTLLLLIETMFGVFFAILIAMTIAKFIENMIMKIEHKKLRINQRIIISKVVRIVLYAIALVTVLETLGVHLSFLSYFGGAFGLGLAFGMQKIAANYVSGFLLLSDESVRVGDVLQIGKDHGRVTAIRARYTAIKKVDGVEILIPNEKLLMGEIINLTFTNTKVKIPMNVQISYESSIDKAFEIILKICKKEKRIIEDPKTSVFVEEFADSGINLHVSCYIDDPQNGYMNLKSDLYRKIFKEFKNNNIEIPYPHRTIISKT